MYFLDPEGNRVEVYHDSPWHVPQPYSVDLDLEKPANQIRDETETACRGVAGFMTAADRSAELAARMA